MKYSFSRRSLMASIPLAFGSDRIGKPEASKKDELVSKIWVSEPNCYFGYPHCNSFMSDSGLPVIAHRLSDQKTIKFQEWDFERDRYYDLTTTGLGDMYWDISQDTSELYFIRNRHDIVKVKRGRAETKIMSLDPGPHRKANQMISVTGDGSRLLYAVAAISDQGASLHSDYYEISNGVLAPIFTANFNANHHQYSPFDPNWIGICHEGDILNTHDRVWGWRRSATDPSPTLLWNEVVPQRGYLLAGHERWMFNRVGVLVVAYHSNTGSPAGLYVVDPTNHEAILVSASETDLHCNIDRSGTWAVVDTLGDGRDRHEADGREISDIILVRMADGKRFWVARSHMLNHPWHAHPHFSPDGQYLIFNDFQRDGAGTPSRAVVAKITFPT